jgi:hypothetical protein
MGWPGSSGHAIPALKRLNLISLTIFRPVNSGGKTFRVAIKIAWNVLPPIDN